MENRVNAGSQQDFLLKGKVDHIVRGDETVWNIFGLHGEWSIF